MKGLKERLLLEEEEEEKEKCYFDFCYYCSDQDKMVLKATVEKANFKFFCEIGGCCIFEKRILANNDLQLFGDILVAACRNLDDAKLWCIRHVSEEADILEKYPIPDDVQAKKGNQGFEFSYYGSEENKIALIETLKKAAFKYIATKKNVGLFQGGCVEVFGDALVAACRLLDVKLGHVHRIDAQFSILKEYAIPDDVKKKTYVLYFACVGSIDGRNALTNHLKKAKFQAIDSTGGQCACEDGDLQVFGDTLVTACRLLDLKMWHVYRMPDPGLGLVVDSAMIRRGLCDGSIQEYELPDDVKHIEINDCHVCTKDAQLKCGGCKRVHYCSVECQKQDWDNHKAKCKEIRKAKRLLGPQDGYIKVKGIDVNA